jgi:hypothetical protein
VAGNSCIPMLPRLRRTCGRPQSTSPALNRDIAFRMLFKLAGVYFKRLAAAVMVTFDGLANSV